MKAFILRTPENEVNDMGMYKYIFEVLGVRPDLINVTGKNLESVTRSLDVNDDVFIAQIYGTHVGFKREWLPSAKKVIFYNQGDYQFRDVDVPTIEMIREVDGPPSILAPYTVRPSFQKATYGLVNFHEPSNDVSFIGLDLRRLAFGPITRKEYLDRFAEAIGNRFNFFRYRLPHALSTVDYAQIMMQSKINLIVHGCSEHTFRYYEALSLGTCIVSQRIRHEVMWADPGEIVPTFDTPEEAANLCADLLSSGAWKDYRKMQQEWFMDCHSEKAFKKWAKTVIAALIEDDPQPQSVS